MCVFNVKTKGIPCVDSILVHVRVRRHSIHVHIKFDIPFGVMHNNCMKRSLRFSIPIIIIRHFQFQRNTIMDQIAAKRYKILG